MKVCWACIILFVSTLFTRELPSKLQPQFGPWAASFGINWVLVTYRKSDRGDIFLGGLHQKVHPEVQQLLLGARLLRAGFLKLFIDQDGFHQRAQIPETKPERIKKEIFIHCVLKKSPASMIYLTKFNQMSELEETLSPHFSTEKHLILQTK